jgi:F-type H+-transporting ATPase subunit c
MGFESFEASLPLATLTTLGKSIGFGLAIGLAAFGTALGVGLIFASMLQSAARQPEAARELRPIMWLGFALTEAVVFYGLVGAMLLVFLI